MPQQLPLREIGPRPDLGLPAEFDEGRRIADGLEHRCRPHSTETAGERPLADTIGTASALRVMNAFRHSTGPGYQIKQTRLGDGSIWNFGAIHSRLDATHMTVFEGTRRFRRPRSMTLLAPGRHNTPVSAGAGASHLSKKLLLLESSLSYASLPDDSMSPSSAPPSAADVAKIEALERQRAIRSQSCSDRASVHVMNATNKSGEADERPCDR